MGYKWTSSAYVIGVDCDYQVAEEGLKILVRFKDPEAPLAHAIQAAVSASEAEGMTDVEDVLLALGFVSPVARDAVIFVCDLLRRFDAMHSLPGARDVLRRVEFKQ